MEESGEMKELPIVELTVSTLPVIPPVDEWLRDSLREYDEAFHFERANSDEIDGRMVKPVQKDDEEPNGNEDTVEKDDIDSNRNENSQPKEERKMAIPFSLMAPLRVSPEISAEELNNLLADSKRVIYDQKINHPSTPTRPTKQIHTMMPIVTVNSQADAHSKELRQFCLDSPIVMIRGLPEALGMNTELFDTDALVAKCPTLPVTIYNHEKVDQPQTWKIQVEKDDKTCFIRTHAQYQKKMAAREQENNLNIENGENIVKKKRKVDESKPEVLKFGSNIDLKNDKGVFDEHLKEIAKLPVFCRPEDESNLLTHVDHDVLGMKSVQLYMKVPGNRTPGHMENNCFASVNMNVGPGDCEWFAVPYEYWDDVQAFCEKNGVEFLDGGWWPKPDDLLQAGIPVYRFTQKAGDLVWVGFGCLHWVQSFGVCNNVAWNVGPMTHAQLAIAIHRYEWNRRHNYHSLVPLMHLSWEIAKNVRVTNRKVFTLIREILIRSLAYCQALIDWTGKRGIKIYTKETRQPGSFTLCCDHCECELFNVLFGVEYKGKDYHNKFWCIDCLLALNIEGFYVMQHESMDDLMQIFSEFKLHD